MARTTSGKPARERRVCSRPRTLDAAPGSGRSEGSDCHGYAMEYVWNATNALQDSSLLFYTDFLPSVRAAPLAGASQPSIFAFRDSPACLAAGGALRVAWARGRRVEPRIHGPSIIPLDIPPAADHGRSDPGHSAHRLDGARANVLPDTDPHRPVGPVAPPSAPAPAAPVAPAPSTPAPSTPTSTPAPTASTSRPRPCGRGLLRLGRFEATRRVRGERRCGPPRGVATREARSGERRRRRRATRCRSR